MKKHLFVFVTLFALLLLSGCGTQKNTVRFDGDEETSASAEEETAAEEEALSDGEGDETVTSDKENSGVTEAVVGKLAITSFDGAYLKTVYSYNVVKGNAPTGTHTIKVNDYRLTKYIPGQTKWDYIASTRFGTLKNGLNTYIVKAYDKEGAEIDSVIFSINYEAPATPETLPGVGANQWIILFSAVIASMSLALLRKYKWL